MQDNLEFLQWSKKYWDQYYPGGEYDAISRRKGAGAPTATATRTSGGTGAARRGTTPTVASTRPSGVKAGGAASSALASENTQLKQTVEGLERERDFYFQKLRDIELLLQNAFENDPKLEEDDSGFFKQVQQVLYSTEVGNSILDFRRIYLQFIFRRDSKYLRMLKGLWMMGRHSSIRKVS